MTNLARTQNFRNLEILNIIFEDVIFANHRIIRRYSFALYFIHYKNWTSQLQCNNLLSLSLVANLHDTIHTLWHEISSKVIMIFFFLNFKIDNCNNEFNLFLSLFFRLLTITNIRLSISREKQCVKIWRILKNERWKKRDSISWTKSLRWRNVR